MLRGTSLVLNPLLHLVKRQVDMATHDLAITQCYKLQQVGIIGFQVRHIIYMIKHLGISVVKIVMKPVIIGFYPKPDEQIVAPFNKISNSGLYKDLQYITLPVFRRRK